MIKFLLQKSFSFIGKGLPLGVQKAIYLLPFYILKRSIKDEVWYRHSVYFGDIEFAYSDLDLSVLLTESHSEDIQKKIRRLKFFFPFIGEVSYFDRNYLFQIEPYANSVELKRDPALKEKMNKEDKDIDLAEEIVFILNWLSHDSHKMRENFRGRKKKIRRFLKILDIEERDVQGITELINLLIEEKFQHSDLNSVEVRKFLTQFSFYDFTRRSADNEFYYDCEEFHRYLFCFFPQRWIGAALHYGEFDQCEKFLSDLSPFEKEIFLKQINWEIWGLMGQWRKGDDLINLLIHCENLKKLLVPLGQDSTTQQVGLDQLIHWQETGLYQGIKYAS